MKLRSGKVIHPISIQEKYEKFNQEFVLTLKKTYELNEKNKDITTNELLILRTIRYLTYNRTNIYNFIDRYDEVIHFINMVHKLSITIYNDLILEFWSLQNYDVGDLSRFEWMMSIVQHNHCKTAINVIEKFKDDLYPRFCDYHKNTIIKKETLLNNLNNGLCNNMTNNIITYIS